MGNLQYRSTVWMCQQMCEDSEIPQESCLPIPLFMFLMYQQMSWGRYAIFIAWLHQHFPLQGYWVFRYLKTHCPTRVYSFQYLAGHYLLYHVAKIISCLC